MQIMVKDMKNKKEERKEKTYPSYPRGKVFPASSTPPLLSNHALILQLCDAAVKNKLFILNKEYL